MANNRERAISGPGRVMQDAALRDMPLLAQIGVVLRAAGVAVGALSHHAVFGPPTHEWSALTHAIINVLRDNIRPGVCAVRLRDGRPQAPGAIPAPLRDPALSTLRVDHLRAGLAVLGAIHPMSALRCSRVSVDEAAGEWVWLGDDPLRETDGVPLDPRACDMVLMYMHGGGFVFGSARSMRLQIALLLQRVLAAAHPRPDWRGHPAAVAFSVDYRLAPEHPFPEPLQDAERCFDYLVNDVGVSPRRIVFVGDSAGGNMAIMLAHRLAQRSPALRPGAVFAESPWVEFTTARPSYTECTGTDFLPLLLLQEAARLYLQGVPPTEADVCPMCLRSLSGLPPMLLHVGGAELLRDSVIAFGERARAEGAPCRTEVYEGMPHTFHALAGLQVRAASALRRAAQWCWDRLREVDAADSHSPAWSSQQVYPRLDVGVPSARL